MFKVRDIKKYLSSPNFVMKEGIISSSMIIEYNCASQTRYESTHFPSI